MAPPKQQVFAVATESEEQISKSGDVVMKPKSKQVVTASSPGAAANSTITGQLPDDFEANNNNLIAAQATSAPQTTNFEVKCERKANKEESDSSKRVDHSVGSSTDNSATDANIQLVVVANETSKVADGDTAGHTVIDCSSPALDSSELATRLGAVDQPVTKATNPEANHKPPQQQQTERSRLQKSAVDPQEQLLQNNRTAKTNLSVENPNGNIKLINNGSTLRQIPTGGPQQPAFCKRRRLSYLQALLLRRWPCLAITVCIMTSLLFGMLLSALTIYFMRGVTDCSGLALSAASASGSPLVPPHELMGRPGEYDTPPDVAMLALMASPNDELGARNFGMSSSGLLGSPPSSASAAASDRPIFQRLSSSVWPLHYDLFVQPYIAEPFNFTGKVSIRIKCNEPTDTITLHTLDLDLNEKTLKLEVAPPAQSGDSGKLSEAASPPTRLQRRQASEPVPKISALSQDRQLQYSILKLDALLAAGKEYVLTIDFEGKLNDDLAGFYKIRYERPNSNETTWIAATQFQATDARRAFPCFDEPLYKATFSIQIKHWKNMTALSNMPIIDSKESSDGLWITDTFGKSHRMSTYLVAYAVTNFESRSKGNISVWTRPGFAHTAQYALEIAGKILRHYEDFFGIEYPLPKMDMIALPDFNAGAMENWGLITYRETAMLYDEATSSVANKQRVAVVVAHELAHQWFGNLVTPKWWDDLWLNEGFASFVEYIGVDHVEPKWQMLDQFVVDEVQNVFKMDGLSSSHQISIPVNNPDEISEIFDHISYAKGASIIRMMNHFLTDDVFKTGLKRYLRALKYSNAEQSDLWAHLTEAQRLVSGSSNTTSAEAAMVDVERVMNSWTLQTGFPLVTLTRNYGKSGAQLDQVRFQSFKSNSSELQRNVTAKDQKWEIPITYTWKSESNWAPRTRIWMHQNESSPTILDSSLVPDDDWLLLNLHQVGYYRVNYDMHNWRLIVDQLANDHKQIEPANRAQIIDDIFELAKCGILDYNFAMGATKYLKNEKDYLPWDTALMSFSYIDDMLQRTSVYGDWKDYVADLIAPYYAKYKDLEWTREGNQTSRIDENDVLEQYNQVNAIAWACQVDESCIKRAKGVFAGWRKSGRNTIHPALRYTTYCTAIENGDKDDWDFLWGVYEKEQNASERDRIMRALGCSKEIWILSRYLEWTFSKTKQIRRQDGAYVFRMIAKNNYGRDIAFNFMRERWSIIREYYGKTSFSLGNLIRSVSTSMNTQVELQQLISFYETIKADVGTGKRSFLIAIEEVESNVAWRNRSYKIIENWIEATKAQSGRSK